MSSTLTAQTLTAQTLTAQTLTAWDVVLYPTPRPLADPDAPRHISARAAFQNVLHERAVLVDLRSPMERAGEGVVADELDPQYVAATELPSWLATHAGEVTEVVLLSQRGIRSAGALRFLRRRYPGIDIADITGGFRAWSDAGMPIA